MEEVKTLLKQAQKQMYDLEIEPDVTYPDAQFGDIATNLAFKLASHVKRTPEQISKELTGKINHQFIEKIETKGGFINFWLKKEYFNRILQDVNLPDYKPEQILAQKTIVVEYSDPNPFKALHVGHLYTSIVGDSISKLLEFVGADVKRVNFGGDVGLHVAKAMWGILQLLGGAHFKHLKSIGKSEQPHWLSDAYVKGATAYEEDEKARQEVIAINKRIYEMHESNDHESDFARIYWECRSWSYDYFNDFYKRIGLRFDKYYPESQNSQLGLLTVKEQLKKGVFEISDGAVVFKGEKHGLHTRVFINSAGLPTYEAKDIGLSLAKWQDYHFDKSIIITGNDIVEYMKVVLKAIEQFQPKLAKNTHHITHGQVSLAGRGKMSSRSGNVLLAEDVLEAAKQANKSVNGVKEEAISLAAVKYTFLKQRIGGNIVFDPIESVNLTGDSGPYLQYVYVRTRSILSKAPLVKPQDININVINPEERALIRHLGRFNETITSAGLNYEPHVVCAYLFELAQLFNQFYEHHRVIGASEEGFRLKLVMATANIMQKGLGLLGITAIERM
jgi:arginyl-tRNA synthetase